MKYGSYRFEFIIDKSGMIIGYVWIRLDLSNEIRYE